MKIIRKFIKISLILALGLIILIGFGLLLWTKVPEIKASRKIKDIKTYAKTIDQIKIGENVKIVGLGEATHGNKEFQKMKLDLLKNLVENQKIRAFALEADFSEGIIIDQYIKSGKKEKNPASNFSFPIYHTKEMNDLIEWMRNYNQNHKDKISFYGFDMQNPEKSVDIIKDYVKKENIQINLDNLEILKKDGISIKSPKIKELEKNLINLKEKIKGVNQEEKLIKKAVENVLNSFQFYQTPANDYLQINEKRDKFMADNICWIQQNEQEKNSKLMIAGHNGHIGKKEKYYKNVGERLKEKYKKDYFVIGSDFYKSKVNIKNLTSNKRIIKKFISADKLAYQAKDFNNIYYLDFSEIKKGQTKKIIENQGNMGVLGEGYTFLNIIPKTYRIKETYKNLYDGMIFVYKAEPIEIIE